ncbi:transcriptional regulator [Luteimicrobium album]|uniref:Transcriptional regulator n=1 Tax=Luteimicrobium album TaxID=1054550 RepID=A0ABQ6I189_9MICO|nr:helix-turn-helix transcriptional regulator [Luteimicrobium album]GMA23535.1 transcriptional regulator [Luteimicrobium album]
MAELVEARPAPSTSGSGAAAARRAELRDFLRTRRARLSPADVGLPDAGRRRTPGLRREEVAVLAGVGASWYQWLEQGRDIQVSPQVLDAVARVLLLSSAERRHLYALAGLNPPSAETDDDARGVGEGLMRLLDSWLPFPAHVMDRYWNCVMYNEAAAVVLGMRPDTPQNCLITFFTDDLYRGRARNWEANADAVVAQFRAACTASPGDDGFAAVVDQLSAVSPEFVERWGQHDVASPGFLAKELEHPTLGTLFIEATQLQVPARPDLTLVLHNPVPGTGTREKLERLLSEDERRAALRLVG